MLACRHALLAAIALGACGDGKQADTAGDAPPDPCAACTPDQRCVQRFDGTCNQTITCVTTALTCATNTCSATCEAELCPRPYQCANRPPCGTEVPSAFTCYGP